MTNLHLLIAGLAALLSPLLVEMAKDSPRVRVLRPGQRARPRLAIWALSCSAAALSAACVDAERVDWWAALHVALVSIAGAEVVYAYGVRWWSHRRVIEAGYYHDLPASIPRANHAASHTRPDAWPFE